MSKLTLPTDSNERKEIPVLSGCLRYFPAALAGVARISKLGNDKHNPGEPLHHARGKSMDHGDCIVRHLMDVQDLMAALERDSATGSPQQILEEVSSLAWRALALSQELHERFGAPLAPGAKEAAPPSAPPKVDESLVLGPPQTGYGSGGTGGILPSAKLSCQAGIESGTGYQEVCTYCRALNKPKLDGSFDG